MKKERGSAISMELYRQLVFEAGTHLMDESWDKDQAMNYLFDLADRPVKDMPVPESDRMAPAKEPACERCHNCLPDLSAGKLVCTKDMDCFNAEAEYVDCSSFDCRYIQYPLTVQGIDTYGIEDYLSKALQFARVRPVGDERTYTGFYLGELYMSPSISYYRKSGMLTVALAPNPAIFVPELGRIVFGYESWWSKITPDEATRNITDADIESQPYVQFFRAASNARYRKAVKERLMQRFDATLGADSESFAEKIIEELDSSEVGPLSVENAKALVTVLTELLHAKSSGDDLDTAEKDSQEILRQADSRH